MTIAVRTSRAVEFVDLTERLDALVAHADVRVGLVNVQSLHTTVAITVNEHEPLLLADFAAVLENAAPRRASYRHDDLSIRTVNVTPDERVNGHAHCQALLLGPSACLNVIDGRLRIGRWQRVFLVELDGPREREISIVLLGESRSRMHLASSCLEVLDNADEIPVLAGAPKRERLVSGR